jgi:hypothetical protein
MAAKKPKYQFTKSSGGAAAGFTKSISVKLTPAFHAELTAATKQMHAEGYDLNISSLLRAELEEILAGCKAALGDKYLQDNMFANIDEDDG